MPASGRHSHKGHRGKRQKSVAPYLLRVSAWFLALRVAGQNKEHNKIFTWPIGGLVEFCWAILQFYMQAVSAGAFSAPFHTLTYTPELRTRLSREGTDWRSAWAMMSALSFFLLFLQRGSTGEMSNYVLFLHSEAGHPLPLNPIGTIVASNW